MTEQKVHKKFEDFSHYSAATVVHDRASRYTKQLVSHWRDRAELIVAEEETTTMFFLTEDNEKGSALRFVNHVGQSEIILATNTKAHASFLIEAIDDHLIRFAGKRDTLEIVWGTPK